MLALAQAEVHRAINMLMSALPDIIAVIMSARDYIVRLLICLILFVDIYA